MQIKKSYVLSLALLNSSMVLADSDIVVNNQLSPETSVVIDSEKNKAVIDIDTDLQKGVSLNFYDKFNVPKNGIVLNNKEAKAAVIINEVTGNEISFIKGNIAVEGPKSHVIIANPNGVECIQCSVSRATDFTLISGKTNDSVSSFILSDKNYVSVYGVKRTAGQKINVVSNDIFMEHKMHDSIKTLNLFNGLMTYNLFSENKFDRYGRISFFENFKDNLKDINIKRGYGEIYIDETLKNIKDKIK